MNRTIRGVFLIILGLLMSISAAAIFARYEYQAEIAGDNAELLLEALTEDILVRKELERYNPAQPETPPTTEMPKTTIHSESAARPESTWKGYEMVGIVRIPSLGMELPILDSWDYDLLQIAPCRYFGSVDGGNLILLGHNYTRHFAPLKKIKVGETVEFCDVNGTVTQYEVAVTEVLQKTELERLTASNHDLTLFTCSNGGYSRFVVRCQRMTGDWV